MKSDRSVLIIGGGIAGLTCATELLKNGYEIKILEGRDRLGGRILTHHDSHLSIPIELGAEFIHGAPNEITTLLEKLRLPYVDSFDTHFFKQGDQLKPVENFWEDLGKIFGKMNRHRKVDQSFDDFIKQHRVSPQKAKLLKSYVEGFHSAPTSIASEKALAVAEQGEEDESEPKVSRTLFGYDRIVEYYRDQIGEPRIELNSIVKRVHWEKGKVEVTYFNNGKSRTETASQALITVPIGVLKSSPSDQAYIEFSPELPLKEKLNGVEMGHVDRIIFVFKSRIWEEKVKEPLGFLHAGPGVPFPTWWTQMPLRVPVITAWQGGPLSMQIVDWPSQKKADLALQTLSKLLGFSKARLMKELDGYFLHDWSKDQFSLGAYSFVRVGGFETSEKLSAPINDTLYFAGEGFASGAPRGTVNGAISTGLKAAKRITKNGPS